MKKNILSKVYLVLCCAALAMPAQAGLIVVSGDTNIADPLDGSLGAPLDPGNATLFSNILGAGSSVLVYQQLGFDTAESSAINNYYNGLSGVTSTVDYGTGITGALLSGVDLFVADFVTFAYSASELDALSDFLAGSGTLFFMMEGAGVSSLNTVLAGLGSTMSVGSAQFDGGFNTTTNIVADPLTAGVSSLTYAFHGDVSGGTALVHSRLFTSLTVVAYEDITPTGGSGGTGGTGGSGGSSSVPEPATAALFAWGLLAVAGARRRRRQ